MSGVTSRRVDAEPSRVDEAYFRVQEHRILRMMRELPENDEEAFLRVREAVRKFWGLVQAAAELPHPNHFGIYASKFWGEFERTAEHRHFDRVRTARYHRTPKYKRLKAERNKTYYREKVKAKRQLPEAKAKLAAAAKDRRRRAVYVRIKAALRDEVLAGRPEPELQTVWADLEAAYERVREVGVDERYTAPWGEIRPLVEAWLAQAQAVVTPIRKDEHDPEIAKSGDS